MYKKLIASILMGSVLSGLALAQPSLGEEAISAKLMPVFGEAPDKVKETPIAGVYEVSYGMEIMYVSGDGRYLFTGDLVDTEGRANLTENARIDGRKVELASLSAADVVEFKASGAEKHVVNIFTDIDCGFCVKLHQEVPKLNDLGVTVRYLAYPRAGVGSSSYQKLVNVWCADNQQDAMNKSKAGEQVAEKTCANPVAKEFELGQRIGVTGTPALLTDSGTLIPGYRPAEDLVQLLNDLNKVN